MLVGRIPVCRHAGESAPPAVRSWSGRTFARACLPSAHAARQVSLDFKYWGKHGEEIAERWSRWQSQ
ncbi:hypothetical protein ACFPTX_13850 [Pseudomonas sp. GCM10022188]|uniref:hypothetical protein n=1 Tax=Pseudomonas TaxID=286 RepID=UPI001E430D70|nr:hypothetical protein [Pseudomonas oryzagri]MCC6074372.1 hypothetical protein [Pseudomonas oryzagri]